MGALTYWSERLRGSDWGEPTDPDTSGFDVRIVEFEGFVHIEMTPTGEEERRPLIALLSLSEAKSFVEAMQEAIARVEPLGER